MNISKSFTLDELTTTNVRQHDNTPGPIEIENLRRLCERVLEPLVKKYPSAIITSAYRSLAVNTAIGGSKTSQHMHGNAVDIVVPRVSPLLVAEWAVANVEDFDQVICEWSWTHIGLCDGKPRGQKMTAKRGPDGKAVYSMGFNP